METSLSSPPFPPPATKLVYHGDGQLSSLSTKVTGSQPYAAHEASEQALFKSADLDGHIVTTESTIFHPQGGGQPSDVGTMRSSAGGSGEEGERGVEAEAVVFDVSAVRLGPGDRVLHLGRYVDINDRDGDVEGGGGGGGGGRQRSRRHFNPGEEVTQQIDSEQRHLFSRFHTAGHVLSLAARHYLDEQGGGGPELIDGKASHVPGMANVEFHGRLIEGKHRAGIQARLDEYLARDMPVEVHEWNARELADPVNAVYMPEGMGVVGLGDGKGEGGEGEGDSRLRCVSVLGAGAYPCGGTHVKTTGECGKVVLYKISRQKGVSKLSYRLE